MLEPCSLIITCWERADLLAPLCVVLSYVLSYRVLGQVWFLYVSIFDLYIPLYLDCIYFMCKKILKINGYLIFGSAYIEMYKRVRNSCREHRT